MRGRGGRGRGRGGVSGQRAGMVATNPMQDTVRNVKSRGGQQRVKMISIDQDQEFQVIFPVVVVVVVVVVC